jgi:hypothetical protein
MISLALAMNFALTIYATLESEMKFFLYTSCVSKVAYAFNDIWITFIKVEWSSLGNACHLLLVDTASFFYNIFMVLERPAVYSFSWKVTSPLTMFSLPPSLSSCHLKRLFTFPSHISTLFVVENSRNRICESIALS